MSDVIRILSMPVDEGGCGWYRIRQPFSMIKKHTPHDVHIWNKDEDNSAMILTMARDYADVITMRPGGELGMKKLQEFDEFDGKNWVMDIDDNTDIISPYNFHYEEYGTEEYYDNNQEKWLWKDGQGGFDLQDNIRRVSSQRWGMKEVDMVTVTTERLADHVRENYNESVEVLPNAINFQHWWKPNFYKKKRLRIGWAGGISHYEDFYSIKEPLNDILREYDIEMYMIGAHFDGIFDKDNKKRVTARGWKPFGGHPYHMMMMDLDVAVIPLADLPFNHYKSAVKWFEMSAMGVPAVVANVPPYSDVIDNGTNAIGYDDTKEFAEGLKSLLDDASMRKRIGDEAYDWVKKNRDAKKLANKWTEAYAKVI